MKIEQTVTRIDDNTVETLVKTIDNDGNVLAEQPYTYRNVRGTLLPCYESLIFALKPYRDCEIEVCTTHYVFRKDLFNVFNSDRRLAVKLADLLDARNIDLIIGDLIN